MSKQPETVFKERVQARLKKEFGLIYAAKIQQVAVRGTPDLLICLKGRFIAWELKTDSGRLSQLQEYNLQKITEAGGIARVVTPSNFEEELACLKRLSLES